MDELTQLLLAARAGDQEALTAFVRRTHPEIWRFCRHLAGPDAADDVTQETYLAAWRSLAGFRGEASARTWLFVIARRTAERCTRRHRRLVALDGHVPPPAPSQHPATAGEPRELLALLDGERRAAIVLTQLLGFSYAEAAEICECPVGTIRSRVARAREELLAAERAAAARSDGAAAGSASSG